MKVPIQDKPNQGESVEDSVTNTSGIDPDGSPKCFIRIKGKRQRFIEFDFAVGSPDLAMEMIMPEIDFAEFCHRHHVIMIDQRDSDAIDAERAEWRTGTASSDRLV